MSSNLFGHNTKYNFVDLKVLIVDDNQHMHNILRDMLLGMRIKKIRHAMSAKEGMQFAEAELPDIMIVDLLMKQTSGFQLIKSIREHQDEAIRDLAVLVLPSYSSVEHVRQARDSGANEVLCKPVPWRGCLIGSPICAIIRANLSKPATISAPTAAANCAALMAKIGG